MDFVSARPGWTVDCAGAGIEKFGNAPLSGKFQHPALALKGRFQQAKRVRRIGAVEFASSVDKVRKRSVRPPEIRDIARMPAHLRVRSQVRRFSGKGVWVTRQYDDLRFEPELVVGPEQTLQQPTAEEPCPPRDEDSLSPQLLPQALGMRQNVVKIVSERVHSQASVRTRSAGTPRASNCWLSVLSITGGPER